MEMNEKGKHRLFEWNKTLTIIVLTILLFISIVVAVSIGPVSIPFRETVYIFLHKLSIPVDIIFEDKHAVVITDIRLPRVLLAGLVGCALAISGVTMQGLFRNPLVEPGFIGISSGAAFGAVLAISLGLTAIHQAILPLVAFLGAIFAMALILLVWRVTNSNSIALLLLLGIGMNAFFSSFTNVLIASSSTEQELRGALLWLQGGLEGTTWEQVKIVGPIILIGSIIICLFGRSLNVMLLGDEQAITSGVRLHLVRNSLLTIVALMTGAAVAVSGIISFVGLVVPHMLRLVIGADHRLLLPASMLTGAIFLMMMDLISRMILQPVTLQVGVVSAMVGAPIFIILILRSVRRG